MPGEPGDRRGRLDRGPLHGPQGTVGVGQGTADANRFAVSVEGTGAEHAAAVELAADLHRVVVAPAHEPDRRRAGGGWSIRHCVLGGAADLRVVRSGPIASQT